MLHQVEIIVGRRIRRRRRLLGLTQAQLGAACTTSFQQIQKYEAADCRVSVAMLWKLACALDVNVDYFFTGISAEEAYRQQTGRVVSTADFVALEAA